MAEGCFANADRLAGLMDKHVCIGSPSSLVCTWEDDMIDRDARQTLIEKRRRLSAPPTPMKSRRCRWQQNCAFAAQLFESLDTPSARM